MSGINDRLQTAIEAVWNLEGILTQDEILEITGKLQGHKVDY